MHGQQNIKILDQNLFESVVCGLQKLIVKIYSAL